MPQYPDTEGDLFALRARRKQRRLRLTPFTLVTIGTGIIALFLVLVGIFLALHLGLLSLPGWSTPQPAPEKKQFVVVPDLVGLNFVDADRAASNAGFRLDVANSFTDGAVTQQSPSSGSKAPQGAPIIVQFALTTSP